MKFTSRLNPTSWALSLLICIQLAFILWASSRGFDFTDEAFSFLGYKYPNEINKVATYYTSIFNSFLGWANVSIIKIRILRLFLMVVCSITLSLGLGRWIDRNSEFNKSDQINLVLFILLGSLLVHANGSQSLTYNNASNFILQLIVGFFLMTYEREFKLNRKDQLIYFCLGALLFALFAIKFSVGIIILFLLILFLIIDKRIKRNTLIYFSFLILGILSMGIFVFGFDLLNWFRDYFDTLKLLSSLTTTSIGSRYIEDVYYTLNSKILDNLFVVISIIILLLLNHFIVRNWIRGVIAFAIASLLIYLSYSHEYYLGGVKYYYIFTGLYIILIFALIIAELIKAPINYVNGARRNHFVNILAIVLLLLPVAGAIGTNNLLSIQIIWYSAFLFAGMFLILYKNGTYIFNSAIIILGLNATLQSLSGLVYHPYRLNQTLYEESCQLPAEITSEKVLVNKEIIQSLEVAHQLIASKTNFKKGDPIFSFSPDYLGFIYLLEGALPGWSWYDEKGTAYNCYNLKNTNFNNLDNMIVLSPSYYQMDSIYTNCFDEMNINFPNGYTKVGEVSYFMGSLDRSFTIFAPTRFLKE
ncbi:MAG TPA: hypothetical protein PK185_07325 [Cyclobacteriaceae bacterium]|nr:hypothetical protein [Cyclobacteriaceae bacterium]